MHDTTTPALPPSASASTDEVFAAVDLGSNSFHLIIARSDGGSIQVIDRHKEMVRLGEGLTDDKRLDPAVAERALACLERMGQRLREVPSANIRVVGTNTLRQLRPEDGFVARAEEAIGHPIEVIAGREEARLIYLGVAHGLAAGSERRLVVDIGGGSTELIVGEGFSPLWRESLHMGCVSMTRRCFPDGKITAKAMERAELTGALEIRPVREQFRQSGWQTATGSSGTIKAIRAVVTAEGWSEDGISAPSLTRLREALLDFGDIDTIDLQGLSEERRPVFVGGVAVLRSVFQNLNISHMRVSDEALREGVLSELIGRPQHDDVRQHTLATLCRRYDVDLAHAERVERTALMLLEQLRRPWALEDPDCASVLRWAARVHEIGLVVSHSQYQKHGAYLLSNADLSGFSRQEQDMLAALVLGHRRKFPTTTFDSLPAGVRESTRRLCIILRLAVLLHRGRSPHNKPDPVLDANGDRLRLRFPDDWLADHPLARLELEEEAARLAAAGLELDFD
jgi:exopolyphosphatase/guanosine-5'-triphosphate,3'-diphosphate pyrophosphatase